MARPGGALGAPDDALGRLMHWGHLPLRWGRGLKLHWGLMRHWGHLAMHCGHLTMHKGHLPLQWGRLTLPWWLGLL